MDENIDVQVELAVESEEGIKADDASEAHQETLVQGSEDVGTS